MTDMFRSLETYNYRVWASGAFVSNVGTWMQRTAQDWIVLTQLTHHNATAVGFVIALQFGPQVLLLPLTGLAADHFERRKLLMVTQAAMGALAFGLGLLTVTGTVELWQVYLFALLLGCVTAFDSPARQTFVSDLVSGPNLSNAVGLNSTSFNAARLIGPAVAGVLIAAVGSGWVFVINAATFGAVLTSLAFLRVHELFAAPRKPRSPGDFVGGFRYVWRRPDVKVIFFMLFLIGTFGLNFPIFLSTMSVSVFHAGASAYGFLTSAMAVGSVAGALLSARRAKPRVTLLFVGASVFGVGYAFASIAPTYWLFALALIVVGVSSQTLTGIVSYPTAHPVTDVVKHAGALADAFRSRRMPVVLVTADGVAAGRTERSRSAAMSDRPAGWADLVPELNGQPEDHTVVKRTWGAFTNTGLDEHLKGLGVTQVVIAGVSTSAGVESTARHAHENGYNVTLAVDAMTDTSLDAHTNSVTLVFPRIGETGTTAEIISLLS